MLIVPAYPDALPTDAEWEAECVSHGGADGSGNMIQWQTYHPAQWHNKNKLEIQAICTELGINPASGMTTVSARIGWLEDRVKALE